MSHQGNPEICKGIFIRNITQFYFCPISIPLSHYCFSVFTILMLMSLILFFLSKGKLQYFGHLIWRIDSFEKTLILGKIGSRRRRGRQRMRRLDGITDSMDMGLDGLRSWWWTGRPGVLRLMGSLRVGQDWVTELNWRQKLKTIMKHIVKVLFYWVIKNAKLTCKTIFWITDIHIF